MGRSGHSSSSGDSVYDDALDARHSAGCFSSNGRSLKHAHPARYAFAQAFGERAGDLAYHFDFCDADMISSVRFNPSADMVATGDKGGRIVILKRGNSRSRNRRRRRTRTDVNLDIDRRDDDFTGQDSYGYNEAVCTVREPPEFQFWTQFQSHELEFDYLKSFDIEQRINEIRWCREANGAQRLLVANDKVIKLWRVCEKDMKEVLSMTPSGIRTKALSKHNSIPSSNSLSPNRPWGFGKCMPPSIQQYLDEHTKRREPLPVMSVPVPQLWQPQPKKPSNVVPSFQELRSKYKGMGASGLAVPKVSARSKVISAAPRRVYSNTHSYHINSLSVSSDEEIFLTADDLRVNVWNMQVGEGNAFNIVDMKPGKMDELTQVITRAEFHPQHCYMFMHASTLGIIKLCDMRQNARCDGWSKVFVEPRNRTGRPSCFTEIVSSISDCRFSPDGQCILTRDYMNLRLWDVRMEREPLLVVPVSEFLRPRLGDMFHNNCLFDKFQCGFTHDGGSLLTGSYNSSFHSYSAFDGVGAAVEATVDFVSGLSCPAQLYADGISPTTIRMGDRISAGRLYDPSRCIRKFDAANTEPLAAVAAGPALYIYYVPT